MNATTLADAAHCAWYARRFGAAALVERDAADAAAAALRVVDVSARVAAAMLPWDTVMVPFGGALARLADAVDGPGEAP